MKPYFYFLENGKLSYAEHEVEELPMSYLLPKNVQVHYRSTVEKSNIGIVHGLDQKWVVFFKEKNDERAKELFSELLNKQIDKLHKKVDVLNDQLKIVEEWRINQ